MKRYTRNSLLKKVFTIEQDAILKITHRSMKEKIFFIRKVQIDRVNT